MASCALFYFATTFPQLHMYTNKWSRHDLGLFWYLLFSQMTRRTSIGCHRVCLLSPQYKSLVTVSEKQQLDLGVFLAVNYKYFQRSQWCVQYVKITTCHEVDQSSFAKFTFFVQWPNFISICVVLILDPGLQCNSIS